MTDSKLNSTNSLICWPLAIPSLEEKDPVQSRAPAELLDRPCVEICLAAERGYFPPSLKASYFHLLLPFMLRYRYYAKNTLDQYLLWMQGDESDINLSPRKTAKKKKKKAHFPKCQDIPLNGTIKDICCGFTLHPLVLSVLADVLSISGKCLKSICQPVALQFFRLPVDHRSSCRCIPDAVMIWRTA